VEEVKVDGLLNSYYIWTTDYRNYGNLACDLARHPHYIVDTPFFLKNQSMLIQ